MFLCDPEMTTLLAGQYHKWDTAHDWSFSSDLVKGKPMRARTRLVYRSFRDPDSMRKEIKELWQAFAQKSASPR